MIFVCKLLNLYNFIFMKIGNVNEYIFRMFQKIPLCALNVKWANQLW